MRTQKSKLIYPREFFFFLNLKIWYDMFKELHNDYQYLSIPASLLFPFFFPFLNFTCYVFLNIAEHVESM